MGEQSSHPIEAAEGLVKWFDPRKGFGFIIGPEGDVLWTGHPANIDRALADAFQKHPPQLVDPKIMSEARPFRLQSQ